MGSRAAKRGESPARSSEMAEGYRHFQANRRGRDFVVGDLHGMRAELERALAEAGFDKEVDRIFSVGDLVDRGPNSPETLKLIDEPWFYAVRGNHEQMMIDVLEGEEAPHLWYVNGGAWARGADLESVRQTMSTVLALPYAIAVDTADGRRIGITHAEFPRADWADVAAAVQDPHDREAMIWGRSVIRGNMDGQTSNVDLTVHGHTPVEEPVRVGNALFIDTGLVYGGPLTLLTFEEALAF